ncbi:hypothetical protein [Maridesulfovibrio bastinii]|uniref:hypothetical protein n=1 Tax=Maridesulfovibrio bastinii TaxID=47157 RepID=UPI0012EC23E1|nr:hypothetical protein [Maridesulfovibrio bastinii]
MSERTYLVKTSNDKMTKFILMCENLYIKRAFKKLLLFCEKNRATNKNDIVYSLNLIAHILTFDNINYEKALELNEQIYNEIDITDYTYQISFRKIYTEEEYFSGEQYALGVAATPIVMIATPILYVFGTSEQRKGIGGYFDKLTSGKKSETEKDLINSKFINTFFNIALKRIKKISTKRLIYLNRQIGDIDEAAIWEERYEGL